jgi:hypothetical protein
MKNKDGEGIHLVSLYFPLDLLEKIRKHAKEHKRSLNKQILWLLEQRLEEPADILTFEDAQRAWFRYAGESYPVASAPTPIFKSALMQRIPHNWVTSEDYRDLLKEKKLDMYDRWYLLCGLIEVGRPLPLYRHSDASQTKKSTP